MDSKFLTDLDTRLKHGSDKVHIILSPLEYYSAQLDKLIIVPAGFESDFASVPRIPLIFSLWGSQAHREATLHDFLYRINSDPVVKRSVADSLFHEAMVATGKPWYISKPMYRGVQVAGWTAYHRRSIWDSL